MTSFNFGRGRIALLVAALLGAGMTTVFAEDLPPLPRCRDAGVLTPGECQRADDAIGQAEGTLQTTRGEGERLAAEAEAAKAEAGRTAEGALRDARSQADPAESAARGAARTGLLAGPVVLWTNLNMGADSGLDADRLDGFSSGYFLDAVAAEALARKTGDDAEAAARAAADAALQARATALEGRASSVEGRASALEGYVNGGAFRGTSATLSREVEVGDCGIPNAAFLDVHICSNTDWTAAFSNGGGDGKGIVVRAGTGGNTPLVRAEDGLGRDRFVVLSNGNVGIGTPAPAHRLDVRGTLGVSGWSYADGIAAIGPSHFGYSGGYRVLQIGVSGSTRAISLGADITGNPSGGFHGNEIVIPNDRSVIAPNGANNGYVGVLGVGKDDRIHIGSSPAYVVKDSGFINILPNGFVGIGIQNPQVRLHVEGEIRADGHIYAHASSHIGDVAEPVVGVDLTPGDLVVSDGFSAGGKLSVRKTDAPYSRGVVGIVSTNPSLTLAGLPTDTPLAVTGIVPVKVIGPVAKDDLLASSAVPGHAMACTDVVQCFGATVGKALEAHDGDGPGTIRVIVGLA